MTEKQALKTIEDNKSSYEGKTLKAKIDGSEFKIIKLVLEELECNPEDEENRFVVGCLTDNGDVKLFDVIWHGVESTKTYYFVDK